MKNFILLTIFVCAVGCSSKSENERIIENFNSKFEQSSVVKKGQANPTDEGDTPDSSDKEIINEYNKQWEQLEAQGKSKKDLADSTQSDTSNH